MTKYTEQFKFEVVQDYLSSGSAGLRTVAQRYGIPSHFMVRKWVLAYQVHGNVGQSGKRSQYSAEFKLSVLRYMRDNQLSMLQSAVKFNIRDHGMVGRWEHAYREGGFEALAPRSRGKPKPMATAVPEPDGPIDDDKRSREELLAEVNQLRMELAYLKKLEALVQARPDDKPMLHSDQGWHYRMPAFRRQLKERQLVQSMSRKGNCLDNAAMESFFAVLKTEFFYLNKFDSVDELRGGLADYIQYYNHDRIKLKLKGLSPVQYRTQALAA